MATQLKFPIEVRHEFLRRLYCTGLSNESIDLVIEQMWYSFGAGNSQRNGIGKYGKRSRLQIRYLTGATKE